MKRTLIASPLAALFGSALTWGCGKITAERTTITRLSPDETLRASLVEREFRTVDRNVKIRLEDLVRGETSTIFHSPDEGGPYGSDRLIWSKDGKWLLLVGRHFFVKEDLFLDNGDQLYFLHHLPSGKSWLNSAEPDRLPALKAGAIEGIEFTEPVRLKAR